MFCFLFFLMHPSGYATTQRTLNNYFINFIVAALKIKTDNNMGGNKVEMKKKKKEKKLMHFPKSHQY